MHIGKFRYKINVASEFAQMSKDDEIAADALANVGHFRQACYFLIQSIEKSIRAKIFTLVNPNNVYFRERNRSHSIESAVEFLIEIVSTDDLVKEQVSQQIASNALGKTKYSRLHNDLRYPAYFEKDDSYSILDINKSDYTELKRRLSLLRKFLDDLHKFS
jgi:HEPN domain-containing protein